MANPNIVNVTTIYGNSSRIVQGPGYVVIRNEMIHEARVVPLDGRAHVSERLSSYLGDSRGHWDGNTLVVVTKNLNGMTGVGGNGGGRTSVRLTITETPVFAEAMKKEESRVKVPAVTVFKEHGVTLILGTMISIIAYTLFYMHSVFALSWGTSKLGYTRNEFLVMQLIAILFFAATIPPSGLIAERGRKKAMIWMTIGAVVYGLIMAPLFEAGRVGAVTMMCLGFGLTGLVYGPLGTVLSELFPTSVRYTGSSIAFNVAGIFGASLAPYAATWLAQNYGLQYVGYYISAVAILSLVGLVATKETKDTDLRH